MKFFNPKDYEDEFKPLKLTSDYDAVECSLNLQEQISRKKHLALFFECFFDPVRDVAALKAVVDSYKKSGYELSDFHVFKYKLPEIEIDQNYPRCFTDDSTLSPDFEVSFPCKAIINLAKEKSEVEIHVEFLLNREPGFPNTIMSFTVNGFENKEEDDRDPVILDEYGFPKKN